MKKGKKLLSLVLSVVLLSTAMTLSVSATVVSPGAATIYSTGSLRFDGSGQVRGDAIITEGDLSGSNNPWATGSIYKTGNVTLTNNYPVNQSIIKDYTGSVASYSLSSYHPFPTSFGGTYSDGTKNVTIGWSSDEFSTNYTLSANSYLNKLTIRDTLNLNIQAGTGEVRIIRIKTLEIRGSISVVGGGRAILYLDTLTTGGASFFNAGGSQDDLAIFVSANDSDVLFDNSTLHANVFAPYSDVSINNTAITGNVYTGGDLKLTNSGNITGYAFAPHSYSNVGNGTYIKGRLITDGATLSGSGYVELGGTRGLPSDIASILGDDAVVTTTAPPTTAAPVITTAPTSPQPTTVSPTPVKMVTITAVVARRMSIRLEDGTVLKNGEKFQMAEGSTVKFQMCTNYWPTDRYSDGGEGIAGAKVFEYTYVKNKEKFLRVDNDRFFQVVKFHFAKGDYSKLTAVDNVLGTPLESLSINFPLGATIKVDAVVKNSIVETKYLFIDSSVYNYTWNY